MAKRIKPLGDGKWCWTENCSEHSYEPALTPPSEKECVKLQQSAKEMFKTLPSREVLLSEGTQEQIAKAREASINAEYAKLHLAITPKAQDYLRQRYLSAEAPAAKAGLESLITDSQALAKAYQRNFQRFHYGSTYVTPDGSSQVRAIPVSTDNIMDVNDWVNEATRKFEEPTIADTTEETVTVNSLAEPVEVDPATKNKTKVFLKKNKLFYRDATGKDKEIPETSYLVRQGKDDFSIVPATSFENNYVSQVEETAKKKMVLNKLERERFFPPTKLSWYVKM